MFTFPPFLISQYARSVSTSYASFEAELEGSILQSTVAVDYYLTQAPKWSANLIDEHATPQKLHSVFIGDMNTSFWQAFTHSRVSEWAGNLAGTQDQREGTTAGVSIVGSWHPLSVQCCTPSASSVYRLLLMTHC